MSRSPSALSRSSRFLGLSAPGRRSVGRLLQASFVLAVCLTPAVNAFEGEAPPTPFVIEEDWEVVIGEPSFEENLPQLYVVTTPTGHIDEDYSVFEINNLLLPDFYGGGLQFQTWYGDYATGEAHHSDFSSLANAGETITFTVRMRTWGDGNVSFRIKNGQSTTWGQFGQDYSLWIFRNCGVNNLSNYDPDKSARFSRVGFGRDRVTSFKIKEVRYYDFTGNLISTDATVRDAQADEPT